MPQPVPWTKATTPSTFGIVGEDAGAVDLLGDEPGDRGRAVHAGQDADIVAGADLAVGAPDSPRRSRAARPAERRSACASSAEAVVAVEIVHRRHCARAPIRPGAIRWREADDLAELQDRRPKGAPILKFGQIIGFASTDIAPGRMGARAQLRRARLRARLSLRRGRAARGHPARRAAGDLPGLPARRTARSARATISAS